MPANVTPEFERAEQRFRDAVTPADRLAALQAMLGALPKHKGTEKMQADIKRRISQLRKEPHQAAGSHGPDPFHIPRSGAGQVVLIGPPNTGKSRLLVVTTHAEAKVADYPFTTLVPQPGMWSLDDIQIELVDTPPLTARHLPGGLMGTIRAADAVSVILRAEDDLLEQADGVLRLLAEKGLTLRSLPLSRLAGPAASARPGLLAVNQIDRPASCPIAALRDLLRGELEVLGVSALTGAGLEEWFRALWRLLGRIRVYAKRPGEPPDLARPFTLQGGATVADLARLIHRDLPQTMKHARLWGHCRFDGQQVHRSEPLQDRDIVEIHE